MNIMKTMREFLKSLLQYHDLGYSMNFSKEFENKISDDANDGDSYSLDYRGLLVVYFYLASKDKLSESEAEYLGQILELAESDAKLALLMNEVDEFTYQDLEYFKSEHLYGLENERARVLEIIVKQSGESLISDSIPDYEALLTDYYTLVMRPTISDIEAEYLGRILDQAQSDPKLALLLNEIDELTYEEIGLTEKDFTELEVQMKQAHQLLASIMSLPQSDQIEQSSLCSDQMITGYNAQQKWPRYCQQYLDQAIQVSRSLTRSKSAWFLILGSLCSAALIKCSPLLDVHQFIRTLMSPKETAVLSTGSPNLSGAASIKMEAAHSRAISLSKKEILPIWHHKVPDHFRSWSQANLEQLEASHRFESTASDYHSQLLSSIKSSQQPEAALEVVSASNSPSNSTVAVIDIYQPEESANLDSSCCDTQSSAQTQEHQPNLRWSLKADPLLGEQGGEQGIVQPEDTLSAPSFEASTIQFQPDEDLDLEVAAVLYASHTAHGDLQKLYTMQSDASSSQAVSTGMMW
jgi:hypothetical protein